MTEKFVFCVLPHVFIGAVKDLKFASSSLVLRLISVMVVGLLLAGCMAPRIGPDKEGGGRLVGALTGAGAGAVTGFQLGVGTGPGAAVGAGFGALAGGMRGAVQDAQEEEELRLAQAVKLAEKRSMAQHVIAEFYSKRLQWHPGRDLYPADVFFNEDKIALSARGKAVIDEFGIMNKERFPWSRFGVVVYVKSKEKKSGYAKYIAEHRALEITNRLIRSGIEPRRVESHGMIVSEEVFRDPDEIGQRYAQAVEFIPLDK
jgi:outer membrane protein OmpA-like peptidoglycan-associated protein